MRNYLVALGTVRMPLVLGGLYVAYINQRHVGWPRKPERKTRC